MSEDKKKQGKTHSAKISIQSNLHAIRRLQTSPDSNKLAEQIHPLL
jgi:hypothetical protein